MKRPPMPKARGKSAERPMVTLTCVVTWPGGEELTAQLFSPSSIEDGKVHWTGAVSRLQSDPPASTSACVLSAFLQHQAELTGGTFSEEQSGPWPAIDEVEG